MTLRFRIDFMVIIVREFLMNSFFRFIYFVYSTAIIPVQEDSTNIQATTNSESREEFFTCDSSSTIPNIGYQRSMTKSKKQSNFKTSFLPPPPTNTKAYTMSNQMATLNIRMESHMGPIHAFRGNYVINSLK